MFLIISKLNERANIQLLEKKLCHGCPIVYKTTAFTSQSASKFCRVHSESGIISVLSQPSRKKIRTWDLLVICYLGFQDAFNFAYFISMYKSLCRDH